MEQVISVSEGKLNKAVTKHDEKDLEGNLLPKKTVVKEREGSTYSTKMGDLYLMLQDYHSRVDEMEQNILKVFKKFDSIEQSLNDLKDIQAGKNPEFEAMLRESEPVPLKMSEKVYSQYGNQVPLETLKLVQSVLGTDTYAFIKDNPGMPSALFTVMIPKRLSGLERDFRSCTIYSASAEMDIKKWCEKVKSHIYRTHVGKGKAEPTFMLPSKYKV